MELSWFKSPLGQNGSSMTSVEGAACIGLVELVALAEVIIVLELELEGA